MFLPSIFISHGTDLVLKTIHWWQWVRCSLPIHWITTWQNRTLTYNTSSSSSVGATVRCGLWPVEQYFLFLNFITISSLLCENVSPTPNPQPGGPGYSFLSGSSPLTCLAWEALPVAYATASIALRIMWPHKPHHYVKVGTPNLQHTLPKADVQLQII